jgi:hypothetical protein
MTAGKSTQGYASALTAALEMLKRLVALYDMLQITPDP